MDVTNDSVEQSRKVHDGKLGWIVVIGAFLAHMITHGIVYSFGMMFSTLEDTFHATKAEIAWIPSIMSGALYLIGPLASVMINRYGCRTVTIIGTFIGFIGYILSIFVSNLYLLYVTMGLVAGCGFGMIFLSAIVIVTQYFIKYRAIACGIGLSGAGVGAFVFSPLVEKLLDVFGWRGTVAVLSAIILNCIVAALSFKPLQKQGVSVTLTEDEEKYNIPDTKLDNTSLEDDDKYDDILDSDVTEEHAGEKLLQIHQTVDYDRDKDVIIKSNGKYIKNDTNTFDENVAIEFVQSNKIKGTMLENHGGDVVSRSLLTRQMLLMKNMEFIAFILSQFLFFFGFYLPFIYIPGKAYQAGISEESTAWIGSTIGLSSVSGRVILGYIADRTSVDRYVMFKAALLIAGVSTSFGPVLNQLWSLMLYAVIFGISTGITLSLTSVVLVDLVGIQMLPDAMGLNNLLSGVGSLIGPPIAGLLYDKTGSYTATFLSPGLAMTISGIVLVLTGCRRKAKRQNAEYIKNEETMKLK